MRYVGLTDEPEIRKMAHGNPFDWWQRRFDTKEEAFQWQKEMLAKPGYTGGRGRPGWRYGYTYTITDMTRQ